MRSGVRAPSAPFLPRAHQLAGAGFPSGTSRLRTYRKAHMAGSFTAVEFISMDLGTAAKFPALDAAARRPPDRSREGDPTAPPGRRAESGDARTPGGNPPDLDLPHRVGPDQPGLGQRAADRRRPEGSPRPARGARRGVRAQARLS